MNTIDRVRHIQALSWEDWREDGATPSDFAPASADMCWIIGSTGYLMARAVNRTTVELHAAALPHTPGFVESTKMVMEFLRHQGCQRFVAIIPGYCRAAQLAAYRAGFRRCGVIHQAVRRDGVLHDLIVREA